MKCAPSTATATRTARILSSIRRTSSLVLAAEGQVSTAIVGIGNVDHVVLSRRQARRAVYLQYASVVTVTTARSHGNAKR